jgi:hypothetical protein
VVVEAKAEAYCVVVGKVVPAVVVIPGAVNADIGGGSTPVGLEKCAAAEAAAAAAAAAAAWLCCCR